MGERSLFGKQGFTNLGVSPGSGVRKVNFLNSNVGGTLVLQIEVLANDVGPTE